MILKKPAPDLIRGGHRFPACAKPWHFLILWLDASAGEGRSEKIMLKQEASDPFELQLSKTRIEAARGSERLVRALLDDAAVVQHQDAVA